MPPGHDLLQDELHLVLGAPLPLPEGAVEHLGAFRQRWATFSALSSMPYMGWINLRGLMTKPMPSAHALALPFCEGSR